MLQKGLINKNRPLGYVSAIAQAPIKPNLNTPIDLTGESNDNSNGIRGRPFRKRKRGSDSDESSDEESTRLLKVNLIDGPKRMTRKQEQIKEQTEREERTIHTCFYDDLSGEFTLSRGLEERCPICKHKSKLRICRVGMKISNEILSNKTINFEENSKPYTTRALFRTKKLSLKLPPVKFDIDSLRAVPKSISLEPEREKSEKKQKVVLFAATENIADMNEKRHISVNDIDFYERNNDDVYANKKTIQDIRRKKDNYRNQMLIEKAIGIYDADGLKSKLDEINCHYCGEIITRSAYEPGRYNSASETFCDFCSEQLKDLYFCQMAIDIRKNERKFNVDYRMKYISKENRKKRKGKKEKSSNKCPHLVVSQSFDSGEVNFISSKKMKYRLSASFNGVNVADDENDEDDEFFKDDEEYKPFEESYYKIQLIQKKFQTNL